MRKILQGLLITGSLVLFAGCGAENNQDAGNAAGDANVNEEENTNANENAGNDNGNGNEDEELIVTTSFSVLGDIIGEITGDRASVEYIVPIGEEPHEYEPVPSNFARVSDSDVFYTNGLGLEEWLEKIVANASDTPIVELSAGVEEIPLEGEDAPDPHAWLSPKNINIYVNNLLEDLIERDPEGEQEYRENAEAYLNEIQELDGWIEEQTADVPEEHRKIIMSENAFKYFGKDYGFETEGLWEINSHEEGTPQQINRIIDIVTESGLPAVFVETTVDKRYMETVSDNTGVPIAGEVYTDAVGEEGSGAETYIDMIRHNVEVFANGLTSN